MKFKELLKRKSFWFLVLFWTWAGVVLSGEEFYDYSLGFIFLINFVYGFVMVSIIYSILHAIYEKSKNINLPPLS